MSQRPVSFLYRGVVRTQSSDCAVDTADDIRQCEVGFLVQAERRCVVINLNRYRKRRERSEAEARAAENRVRFGRSKEQRNKEQREGERATHEIENKRLD